MAMLNVHPFLQTIGSRKHPSQNSTVIEIKVLDCLINEFIITFKNGSALNICANKLFMNSSGSFSSLVNPVTELNLSNR